MTESISDSKSRRIFSTFPAVEAVYLFGAAATGREHQERDVDLGVAGDPEDLSAIKLNILTELARHGFCQVDLVFLEEAPPTLAHEIVKHNRVV